MRTRITRPFAPLTGARRHPRWNEAVCGVLRYPRYVEAETCRRIRALGEEYPVEDGRLADGRGEQRRNQVRWIPLERRSRWLFERVEQLFFQANARFDFVLSGFAEPLQLVDYGREGHIDWHLDCTREASSTRKLVATLLLSSPRSFVGGELEFSARTRQDDRAGLGDAIVFPAFLSHRVTPVQSGRRTVLVAWAHGPAFR